MKLDDFEKLQEVALKEIAMPDTIEKIIEKNNLLPAIVQKWIKLYSTQKIVCSNLTVELGEIYGDLYKCFKMPNKSKDIQAKYNLTINEFWDNAKAIESQINVVPAYIAKMKELNQQKYILDFIEKTLDNIRKLGFAIKNYLDYKKILMANY